MYICSAARGAYRPPPPGQETCQVCAVRAGVGACLITVIIERAKHILDEHMLQVFLGQLLSQFRV